MAGRWTPPDERRVPMNVHPHSRDHVEHLLMTTLMGTGVGYSEFLFAATDAFQEGKWEVPGVERPKRGSA